MKTEHIIIAFCIIAVLIPLNWGESQFKTSEIKLINYPSSASLNSINYFAVIIEDARENRNYTASVFFNEQLQDKITLKKGVNTLQFNALEERTGKVRVLIYDNENDFNGFGSKPMPWELFFAVDVNG